MAEPQGVGDEAAPSEAPERFAVYEPSSSPEAGKEKLLETASQEVVFERPLQDTAAHDISRETADETSPGVADERTILEPMPRGFSDEKYLRETSRQIEPVAPSAPEEAGPEKPAPATATPPRFEVPAQEEPDWLKTLIYIFFVPLLLTGGNPMMGALLGLHIAMALGIPPLAGAAMGMGFLSTPTFAGLMVLYHRHQQYRSCIVDDRGVIFGRTPKWTGVRIPWHRLAGFQITGNGVMLTVNGQPWTRWLGPTIKSEERKTHEIVMFLESLGVRRLDE